MTEGLWAHQREAVAYARNRLAVLLHIGMGAGKTRTAIEILREVIDAADPAAPVRVLVCCPKAVVAAWKKQAGLWMPELRVLALESGSGKQKEELVRKAFLDPSPVMVVINYESAYRLKLLEKTRWVALVWDEVHRLKSPSGSTSRWAARVCTKNPTAKRIGLSGTMVPHSPLDTFGVWRSVEAPECQTFGTSYTAFKAKHCITNPHVPGMVLRFIRQDEMQAKIAATTFFRRTEDCVDLPELSHEEIGFELSAEEARVYRELEIDFCALVRDSSVTPKNAMIGALRLLQGCGGYTKLDDAVEAIRISDGRPAKAGRFAEWLEDLPEREPLVVFCNFTADIAEVRAAAEKTGRTVSELSGRVNDLATWQAGRTDVLVSQIKSGGIGIDLTRASYGVFYSIGYSLSEYLQAVARLHRPGQTKHTRFYSLVAYLPRQTSSIEGRVYQALAERRDVVDALVSHYGNVHHSRALGEAR